jgi:hypothetical protein
MGGSLSINPAQTLSVGFTLQGIRLGFDPPRQCTATVVRNQPGEFAAEVRNLAPRAEPPAEAVDSEESAQDSVAAAPATPASASPTDWAAGEKVLFIAHLPEGRFLGSSTVTRWEGSQVSFATDEFWDALDVRHYPRFATSLAVRITPPSGRKISGILADISLGGARVAMAEPVTLHDFLLEVDDGGFGSWLPCRVVGSHQTAGAATLHLEFVDLSPSQIAFVRNLVTHARAGGAHGGLPLAG